MSINGFNLTSLCKSSHVQLFYCCAKNESIPCEIGLTLNDIEISYSNHVEYLGVYIRGSQPKARGPLVARKAYFCGPLALSESKEYYAHLNVKPISIYLEPVSNLQRCFTPQLVVAIHKATRLCTKQV